jgi:hypothetical protein
MMNVSFDFYLGAASVGPIGIKHTISLCEIPVYDLSLGAFSYFRGSQGSVQI